ncbi:hypothetical protein K488DRAFT_75056 [Vararia minispora EC-137]|uniref:Uncharacterized protein n=1 Tax=Vararia minispora EC-137 TaxID=1314806 RepID=A0ACB8Q5D1_9AGAM|nr:hypothetical protein K488DRAFT_75056 [Vararia minispora EC-137]
MASLPEVERLLYPEDEDAIGSTDEEGNELPSIRGYSTVLGKGSCDSAVHVRQNMKKTLFRLSVQEKLLAEGALSRYSASATTRKGGKTIRNVCKTNIASDIPDLWQATMYYKVDVPRPLSKDADQPLYVSNDTSRTIDREELDNLLLSKFPEWEHVARIDSVEYCKLLERTTGVMIKENRTLLPFHHPDNPLRIDTGALPEWLKLQIKAGELNPNATLHQLLDYTASEFLAPSNARWAAIKADAFDHRGVLRFWHEMHKRLSALSNRQGSISKFDNDFLGAHFSGAHIRLLQHMRRNLVELSRVVRHIRTHLMLPISLLVLRHGEYFADEIVQGIPGHRNLDELIKDAPDLGQPDQLSPMPESRPWSPVTDEETDSSAGTYEQLVAEVLSKPLVANELEEGEGEDHQTLEGETLFRKTWIANTMRAYSDPGNPLNAGKPDHLPKYLVEGMRIGRLTKLSSAIDFSKYINERRSLGTPEYYQLTANPNDALELDTFMINLTNQALANRLCRGGDTLEAQLKALTRHFPGSADYTVGLSPIGYDVARFGVTQIVSAAGFRPRTPSSMPSLESLSEALDNASDMSVSSSTHEERRVLTQNIGFIDYNPIDSPLQSCRPRERHLNGKAVRSMLEKPSCAGEAVSRFASSNPTPPPPAPTLTMSSTTKTSWYATNPTGSEREPPAYELLKAAATLPEKKTIDQVQGHPGVKEDVTHDSDVDMSDAEGTGVTLVTPRKDVGRSAATVLNPCAEPFVPRRPMMAQVFSVHSSSAASSLPFSKDTEQTLVSGSRVDPSRNENSPASPMVFTSQETTSVFAKGEAKPTGFQEGQQSSQSRTGFSGIMGIQPTIPESGHPAGISNPGVLTPYPGVGWNKYSPALRLESFRDVSLLAPVSQDSGIQIAREGTGNDATGNNTATPPPATSEPAYQATQPVSHATQSVAAATFSSGSSTSDEPGKYVQGTANHIHGPSPHGHMCPRQEEARVAPMMTYMQAYQNIPIQFRPRLPPPTLQPFRQYQAFSRPLDIGHEVLFDPYPSRHQQFLLGDCDFDTDALDLIRFTAAAVQSPFNFPMRFELNPSPILPTFTFRDLRAPQQTPSYSPILTHPPAMPPSTVIHVIELLVFAFDALFSQSPNTTAALFNLDRVLAQHPFRANVTPLLLPASATPQLSRINPFPHKDTSRVQDGSHKQYRSPTSWDRNSLTIGSSDPSSKDTPWTGVDSQDTLQHMIGGYSRRPPNWTRQYYGFAGTHRWEPSSTTMKDLKVNPESGRISTILSGPEPRLLTVGRRNQERKTPWLATTDRQKKIEETVRETRRTQAAEARSQVYIQQEKLLKRSSILPPTTPGLRAYLTERAKHRAQTYRVYKPVATRAKPVSTRTPPEVEVVRKIPRDPLLTLPSLSPNPPEFTPTGWLTAENVSKLKLNSDGFLWPEEEKLFYHILALNQTWNI